MYLWRDLAPPLPLQALSPQIGPHLDLELERGFKQRSTAVEMPMLTKTELNITLMTVIVHFLPRKILHPP
jgi:hypothetical protein